MMDRDRIIHLIRLLKGSRSAELAVREGDLYVRVRRGWAAPSPTEAPGPAATAQEANSQPPAQAGGDAEMICAKLVGRFYRGKGPGQPPLVKMGDRVAAGQVVGIIEALGKLTSVVAPRDGQVVELLCEDGQAVGYGAPLIRLRRVEE